MKLISYDNWKIILACKGYSNIYDGDDIVNPKQVLKEHLNMSLHNSIDDESIYYILKNLLFDIFGIGKLYEILLNENIERVNYTDYDKENNAAFYSASIGCFIKEFESFGNIGSKNDKFDRFFVILDESNNPIPRSKANEEWIGKDKDKGFRLLKEYNFPKSSKDIL